MSEQNGSGFSSLRTGGKFHFIVSRNMNELGSIRIKMGYGLNENSSGEALAETLKKAFSDRQN